MIPAGTGVLLLVLLAACVYDSRNARGKLCCFLFLKGSIAGRARSGGYCRIFFIARARFDLKQISSIMTHILAATPRVDDAGHVKEKGIPRFDHCPIDSLIIRIINSAHNRRRTEEPGRT
jgi:hypothetical protein